ncbi:MAG: DNA topoisomerase 4 subunit A [bacterium]|nr:DNA topoisomerase 4 subunit A [bacterium]
MENKNTISAASIETEMKEAYVDYAMSVIVARALPDARDGFKPVHRRIIYTMFEEHITPDKKFRKSAATVGNVLARYHPHGDASVYDAMVRLAQPFSMRYPLVWPQGNFGSLDGDPPAHMRYTEAKLARLAMDMVQDIGKNTVDWRPNFDNSTQEPVILPLLFPNLLINGSEGIAVGMACHIPPHNLGETIDACIALLRNPNITINELMQYVKGPDFPTGALIVGTNGIRRAYLTGRGRLLMRAVAHREEIDGCTAVVVDEIPYLVNKASLVEKAAQAIKDKKINGVRDLRDESSRKGIRIVFELKKKIDPDVAEREIFSNTYLETGYSIVMLALVDNAPKILNLREALSCFIDHRVEVVTRRTTYDLNKAKARLHIVEGLLKALEHIHEIIAIIKGSANTGVAKASLMERYEFSELQVQAVLDMRLQRLTHLERSKLEEERDQLIKTINWLQELLDNRDKMNEVITTEFLEVKARYNDERRTRIVHFDNTPADVFTDIDDDSDVSEYDSSEEIDVDYSDDSGDYEERHSEPNFDNLEEEIGSDNNMSERTEAYGNVENGYDTEEADLDEADEEAQDALEVDYAGNYEDDGEVGEGIGKAESTDN